jgi:ATP-binding cassette subfamily C protein
MGREMHLKDNPYSVAFKTIRSGLIGVGVFSALMNILLLTGPFYMLQIYDRVLASHSVPTLVALSVLVAGLLAIYGLFDFLRTRLMVRLAAILDLELADQTFEASVSGPLKRPQFGDPARDLRTVRQFITSPAAAGLFDIPWFPFYIGVVFLLHSLLGWLAIFGAFVLITLAMLNAVFSRAPELNANQSGFQEDQFLGISRLNAETVVAMGMMGNLKRQWFSLHEKVLSAGQVGADSNARFTSLSRALRLILQSAILGVGAYLVIGNELSPGALIAASIIFARALAPVDMAVAQWRGIVAAYQSWGRLGQAVLSIAPREEHIQLELPKKTIILEEFSVTAPHQEKCLAELVSFELKAGEGLGIIGASGSGKSSLLRGLVGVWPSPKGEMRVDGATLDQWSDEDRGKFIGYLPQDVLLFDGTIAENIARFQESAPSEKILEAAKRAGVHNLVLSLPDGYETIIGASGVSLSAGERQRIGLARAIYDTPFLVVLDEPNAHIDADGEQALIAAISQLREAGSIVIVVAHRRAAIANIEKLLFMHDGKAQAFGEKDKVMEHIAMMRGQKSGALRIVKH